MSEYCKNCYKIQAQYEKAVNQNRQLQTENRMFITALDEIEKIIQTITETNKIYPLQNNLKKLLNLINEVKDGEE